MTPSTTFPSVAFKLEINASVVSDIVGIKIIGISNGVSATENFTFDGPDTKYTTNFYTSITSITSRSFTSGDTVVITAIDDAYQPIYWDVLYGPYPCVFSTLDGMAAGIQPEPIGLRTVLNHYVRLTYRAPVYKNMEFTITPGYIGKTFVAITDFDIICLPPKAVAVEWAFRSTEKEEV